MKKILIILVLWAAAIPVYADTAAEKGLEIALEADRRSGGFGNYTTEMMMILRNRLGQEGRRDIRTRVLETNDDGDKSMTIFDTPGDIRGTALLTHTHKKGDDDQWLYLPALKRVKRISSRNKSGAFMGSEFAYEDLGSREVEKYTYTFLGEQTKNNMLMFIVELRPRDQENSGYSKIVALIDQQEYRPWKEEYYDKRGNLLKTLTLKDYHQYLGFHWQPHRMEMVNHQNGKQTDLLRTNFRYQTGLTDRDLHKNSLKRIR